MTNRKPAKALNRKVIHLPSLVNEDDGTPFDVVIRKISPRQIGMDATLGLVQKNALIREAAYRGEQGAIDVKSVSTTEPYPGTPLHHEEEYTDKDDPRLHMALLRQSEIAALKAGLVTPTYDEMCEAYGADPEVPWLEMGSDFDALMTEIGTFSGFSAEPMAGKVMTPPEAERFPAGVRADAGRDGGEVR